MRLFTTLLFLFPTLVYANTVTFKCNYNSYSDQEGNHKVKQKFELNFIIDEVSGKSYMMGKNGTVEVVTFLSDGQITFVEKTQTGNIMTTTIDSASNSVHSRDTVIFGEILPSQYYGKCVVK